METDSERINNGVYDLLIDSHGHFPYRYKVITGYYYGLDVLARNRKDNMCVRCNIKGLKAGWNFDTHDYILLEDDCDLGI